MADISKNDEKAIEEDGYAILNNVAILYNKNVFSSA